MNQYTRSCKSDLSESFLWKTSRSLISNICKRLTGYVEKVFRDQMQTRFYCALMLLKFEIAQKYLADVFHVEF
jgi:hypothetical protein